MQPPFDPFDFPHHPSEQQQPMMYPPRPPMNYPGQPFTPPGMPPHMAQNNKKWQATNLLQPFKKDDGSVDFEKVMKNANQVMTIAKQVRPVVGPLFNMIKK